MSHIRYCYPIDPAEPFEVADRHRALRTRVFYVDAHGSERPVTLLWHLTVQGALLDALDEQRLVRAKLPLPKPPAYRRPIPPVQMRPLEVPAAASTPEWSEENPRPSYAASLAAARAAEDAAA